MVTFMGFRSTGIEPRTTAADWMSCSGKSVRKGSLVAMLQSIGCNGLTYAGTIAIGTIGSFAGQVMHGWLFHKVD